MQCIQKKKCTHHYTQRCDFGTFMQSVKPILGQILSDIIIYFEKLVTGDIINVVFLQK